MNAVAHFARLLSTDAVRRLAALKANRFAAVTTVAPRGLDTDAARHHVTTRWDGDLCLLLNAMTRQELTDLAEALGMSVSGRAPQLREQLWERGAALERRGVEVSPKVQPRPVLLGGHLVVLAPPRGMYPPSEAWPRPLPPPAPAAPPDEEPDSLDELLAAADRAIGVRLGARGRDKGAWGLRAAALLGVVERGGAEPDWRGDVEIKTVPVAREDNGLWRIVEDPAIAMLDEGQNGSIPDSLRSAGATAKLQRTLWLARSDAGEGDATIVSWYLLEWDPTVARLARRYLHVRPKGPAGTDQRGLYLHKRFFADAGMLATLNGVS